jgi:sec-independent protein translocase protein TatA
MQAIANRLNHLSISIRFLSLRHRFAPLLHFPDRSAHSPSGKPLGEYPSACMQKENIMFGLGMPELVVILVIALIVFGPSKLPSLGKSLGEAIQGFKKGIAEEPKNNVTTNQKGEK